MRNKKIGILGCGYACDKDLDARLAPWFELAKKYDFVFSFVSARFQEYDDMGQNVPTASKFLEYVQDEKVQYVEIPNVKMSEADARNLANRHLLHTKCDFIWLLDLSDEYYTIQNIENILRFVDMNPYSMYFKIPFKNYVFDGKQWIAGFCPPRIFVRETPEYLLDKFYWDNDVFYRKQNTFPISEGGTYTGSFEGSTPTYTRHWQIAGSAIPEVILNQGVRHMTWLHENGKDKVAYQLRHFGHCSYKWNDVTGKLEFDLDFYVKHNQALPQLNND